MRINYNKEMSCLPQVQWYVDMDHAISCASAALAPTKEGKAGQQELVDTAATTL